VDGSDSTNGIRAVLDTQSVLNSEKSVLLRMSSGLALIQSVIVETVSQKEHEARRPERYCRLKSLCPKVLPTMKRWVHGILVLLGTTQIYRAVVYSGDRVRQEQQVWRAAEPRIANNNNNRPLSPDRTAAESKSQQKQPIVSENRESRPPPPPKAKSKAPKPKPLPTLEPTPWPTAEPPTQPLESTQPKESPPTPSTTKFPNRTLRPPNPNLTRDYRNPRLDVIVAGVGSASFHFVQKLNNTKTLIHDCHAMDDRGDVFALKNLANLKAGLYCSDLLYSKRSLGRLRKVAPRNATFYLVLPHPLWYLQELMLQHDFVRQQALNRLRYETIIVTLGQSALSLAQLRQMASQGLPIVPVPWHVQILASHEAIRQIVGPHKVFQSNNQSICHTQYTPVRHRVLRDARVTRAWLHNRGVAVDWEDDPCASG